MTPSKIPVSVLVMTLNEEKRIERCLSALQDFSEIVVVDSGSSDKTCEIAERAGARVKSFTWNGQYPKKKQFSIDEIELRHDWVLFVDADEIVTHELTMEINDLFSSSRIGYAGYFIAGYNVINGKILRHGWHNRKIALFDSRMMKFPVINDLDLPGSYEIEGHYQPVLLPEFGRAKIGRLKWPMLHYSLDDSQSWDARHQRYATWERGMNQRRAWPSDPLRWRRTLKKIFRMLPGRAYWAFIISYILMGGFLDGRDGLNFALTRYKYYQMI